MSPQIEASGIIAQLSRRVIPKSSAAGSNRSMSRLRVWSGQLEYPAAGFMTLNFAPSGMELFTYSSSHNDAASARVSITARNTKSSCVSVRRQGPIQPPCASRPIRENGRLDRA